MGFSYLQKHHEAGKKDTLHCTDEPRYTQGTNCVQMKRFEGSQVDLRSRSLAYTMEEQRGPAVQHHAADGRAEVVQCFMDIDAVIDAILNLIPGGMSGLRKDLDGLRTSATLKEIKTLIDKNANNLGGILGQIYEQVFNFYGFHVTHFAESAGDETWEDHLKTFGLENEGLTREKVTLADKSRMLDELNEIFSTKTGGELLSRIAKNSMGDKALGVDIVIGFQEASRGYKLEGSRTENDQMLKGNAHEGFRAGSGIGSVLNIPSEVLFGIIARNGETFINHIKRILGWQQGDDPRILLAHELIHALHGQMGIMPTWEMLLKMQSWPYSPTLDAYFDKLFAEEGFDHQREFVMAYPEFDSNGCSPDDVLTTGIRDDIKYPEPLKEVRHINENRIRREMDLPLRTKY